MDFQKKAEEVWNGAWSTPVVYQSARELISYIRTALEQAYKEGVEAMRDAAARNWTRGITYSAVTAQSFVDMAAVNLLSKFEEVK